MKLRITSLILLSLLASACTREELVEGGLYSTRNENGTYSIVKVLKLDDKGVHVRVYSNQFDTRPENLDETTLHLAGVDHKPNELLGMGHLPISRESFKDWNAQFIKAVPVTNDELDGYEEWKKAQGGYF